MFKVLLALLVAVPATAQIPERFTNLQFLPEDIERGELMETMRGFSFALGVRCEYCHVGGPDLDTMSFAADEKETKRTARRMLAMVRAINTDYIEKLEMEHASSRALTVQCATCHRGVARPELIESILRYELESDGVRQLASRYRELREEYYGSGSYDFSVGPLNRVAETLLRSGDVQAALDILDLNAEFHDDSLWLMNLLAQAHLANDDRDAARAALERALEMDPESEFVKKQLEALGPKN